jgi:hypothetical protein
MYSFTLFVTEIKAKLKLIQHHNLITSEWNKNGKKKLN